MNSSKPTTTIGRRLRQNATRDLNMARRLSWNGGWAFDLIRWRRLQHVAQEHGPVAHDQFSRLQTGENLNPAICSQAGLDDSLHKMAAIGWSPKRSWFHRLRAPRRSPVWRWLLPGHVRELQS